MASYQRVVVGCIVDVDMIDFLGLISGAGGSRSSGLKFASHGSISTVMISASTITSTYTYGRHLESSRLFHGSKCRDSRVRVCAGYGASISCSMMASPNSSSTIPSSSIVASEAVETLAHSTPASTRDIRWCVNSGYRKNVSTMRINTSVVFILILAVLAAAQHVNNAGDGADSKGSGSASKSSNPSGGGGEQSSCALESLTSRKEVIRKNHRHSI